jgi:hypothetical protein
MRKVHASTGCDASSVCARRKNKPREIASYLTASKRAKSLDMPE